MNYCYVPDKNFKNCIKIPNINYKTYPTKYCSPQKKDSDALKNCQHGIPKDYDPNCIFSKDYTQDFSDLVLGHECSIENGAENHCGTKPEQQQCRTDFKGHCDAWNFCQDIRPYTPKVNYSAIKCPNCLKTIVGTSKKHENLCYLGSINQQNTNACNLPENVYIEKKDEKFCCVGNFN